MSNDGGREQRKDPASVFQTPEPEACKAAPEGRLDTLWPIDLGEFVVGSEHEVSIRAPRNLDALDATGDLLVDAALGVATTITGSWENSRYQHGKQAGPFRFKYKPEKPGLDRATVLVTVRWADGHIESRTATITARARAIDAAPAGAKGDQRSSKGTSEPEPKRAKDTTLSVDGNAAATNLHDAHGYLMAQQREGIHIVEREAARFKPKPAPPSIWQQLADLAITVGIGGIASVVSKYVGDRVGQFLFRAQEAEATAKSVEQSIHFGDRKARDAVEGPIVPTPTLTAESTTATHKRAIQDFTSGRLQAAVTGIFNKAAAEVTSHDESAEESTAPQPHAASKDKEIAFFSAQRAMQNKAAALSSMDLTTLVGEILKTQPEHGPRIVDEMLAGMMKAGEQAADTQANATSGQFATYVARTKLGTQSVETSNGKKTVTDLDSQRKFENPALTPGLAAGVLEIEVSRDVTSGAVDVTHARINNVSWLVADRLLDLDLRTAGVPLRISVNHGATLITLDESGRVRVGGGPLELRGPNLGSEAQNIREAERIVHAALRKPLRALNPEIQLVTNDANQARTAAKDLE